MRINKSLSTAMYKILDEEKQVSRLAFDQDKFHAYCKTINHIGDLSDRVQVLGDFLLKDFQIPSAIKDLVIPRKIRLYDGDEYNNLKDMDYYKGDDFGDKVQILDATEFSSVSKAIVNSQRKSGAAMTDMATASAAVVLSTVQSRVLCDNDNCLRGDELFVPIVLCFNPVDEDFLGTKNEAMLKLWFKAALDAF